jgi:hypothetical protein
MVEDNVSSPKGELKTGLNEVMYKLTKKLEPIYLNQLQIIYLILKQ